MCQHGVSGNCAMTANSLIRYICMAMMGTLQAHLLSFQRLCVRIALRMNAMLRPRMLARNSCARAGVVFLHFGGIDRDNSIGAT